MLAISRFSSPGPSFAAEAAGAVEWWSQRPGCLSMELVQNLDEPELWALVSRWESVGAYRRSFNGFDAKMLLTPLLSRALDEPSAYLPPDELGENVPRGC
ncbi:antibiotic biosynthesis monooxygenase family protein [Tessaracoccus sp. MC1756]|uniref:antibiotic biosynthesis monooxygenase family protein n=1 Tax=Tessaracoccus sp. MC1756 TaxID=2760311 RepID=UPI00160331F4|nr:antibiotic biosynthesis monooxygenase family protein [Tessaracoccus sp. MC1756]MBB1510083.1 antibiotic biosynthesis monooxygenase [Tessaracoccus sp. MC1756]